MQIKLKLSSFNYKSISKVSNKILQKSSLLSYDITGPIYLPKKKTLFTVLKSPHVNKKSRNQFKLIIYKRLLVLDCNLVNNKLNKEEIKIFLNYIKKLSGAVQIQIQYLY
jgi:ribosomal protein S10